MIGKRESPVQLGECIGSPAIAASSRVGTPCVAIDAARQCRQAHGDGVLGEAHDAKAAFAGHAFVTFAVKQRDDLQVAALGIGMGGALRQRDLELVAAVAFDEHPRSVPSRSAPCA